MNARQLTRRLASLTAVAALALIAPACTDDDPGDDFEDAAEEAGDNIGDAVDDVGDSIEDGADELDGN